MFRIRASHTGVARHCTFASDLPVSGALLQVIAQNARGALYVFVVETLTGPLSVKLISLSYILQQRIGFALAPDHPFFEQQPSRNTQPEGDVRINGKNLLLAHPIIDLVLVHGAGIQSGLLCHRFRNGEKNREDGVINRSMKMPRHFHVSKLRAKS